MLYPMFAMILLTFVVAAYLLRLRIKAVKSGEVRISAFRFNHADNMPDKLLQAARNFSNLFEVPTLFYVASVTALVLQVTSYVFIAFAWLYVVFRAWHSWIHLSSNNVIRRMQAFMASNACLLIMWGWLLWSYTAHN